MGKNAKEPKKSKALKANQVKQTLTKEESAPIIEDAKVTASQEAAKPIEEKKVPVAVVNAPSEGKKKEPKSEKKKSATKKAPAAKAEAKKKPGRKPMTAAEKAANAKARAEEKKKAESMTPTLTMQYGGRDIDVKALVQAAKDDFKANLKRTLLTELNLYLKPEESTLYYVANGSTEGKIKF
jgi:hypothetical protein